MSRKIPLIGALVIGAIVLISYHPNLRMGFYLDDWIYVERAGRTDWSNALVAIFDPRVWTVWYRPLQAIQWFIEWQIFGNNPNAYHIVNNGFHAINALLLYALVARVTRKWRVGFASAFFYATFTVYISGVNWVGIVDPLATMPYLACIWFWITYLEKNSWQSYVLAVTMFVLALMAKQTAITLPPILFLIEWWLMHKPIVLARLMREYALFAIFGGIFLLIQSTSQSTHTFVGVFGWHVGAKMAYIFSQYLVLFFFPWGDFPSIDLNPEVTGTFITYAWTTLALILLATVIIRKRSRALVLLCVFALITLIPVLPFPFLEHRYLYLPLFAGAIFLGALFDSARARLNLRATAASALALLALGNAFALNDSAIAAAEWARQLRVPFRDIERAHPTFPPDTHLYFIDPITPVTGGLSGMFFGRYGRGVTVGGWDDYANLRAHQNAFVYLFDAARRAVEIPVEKNIATRSAPDLPIQFAASIQLEGFEIARATLKPGAPLVLMLYWRATDRIETDYTVFAHLLAPDGKVIAQSDSAPRKGKLPTTQWETRRLVVDAIVLNVPGDAPLGNAYKIQIGLYDATTGARVPVIGAPTRDSISLAPFQIVE
ncbi:MAG: glycosyltransferase family 39 protein [Chloroflexi bacterium]|nr:glycosyltransferase family 39 protein [Chloroflexota bacterium]